MKTRNLRILSVLMGIALLALPGCDDEEVYEGPMLTSISITEPTAIGGDTITLNLEIQDEHLMDPSEINFGNGSIDETGNGTVFTLSSINSGGTYTVTLPVTAEGTFYASRIVLNSWTGGGRYFMDPGGFYREELHGTQGLMGDKIIDIQVPSFAVTAANWDVVATVDAVSKSGSTTTMSFTITNNGNVAIGDIQVALYLYGPGTTALPDPFGAVPQDLHLLQGQTIEPGKSVQFLRDGPTGAFGTGDVWRAFVYVDTQNWYKESNETNNLSPEFLWTVP